MPIDYFANTLTIQHDTENDFSLPEKQVAIWLCDASNADLQTLNLKQVLHPHEHSILAQRKKQQAQQEYCISRMIIKRVLVSTFAHKASEFASRFDAEQRQLQLWHHDQLLPVSVSLSHSNGFVAVAMSLGNHAFGLDLERTNKPRAFLKLAKHFYHPDEVALIEQSAANEQQAACFYRIWTLKEALAKTLKKPIAQLLRPNVFELIQSNQLHSQSTQINQFDLSLICASPLEFKHIQASTLNEKSLSIN